MKKIVYLVIAFLVVSSVAVAQAPRGGGAEGRQRVDAQTRADRLTERLVKEYSLTDEQKKQVSDATLTWAKQLDVIVKSDKNREGQREEIKKASDTYDAQLKEILTGEQYDAYTKAKAAAPQASREKRGEGNGNTQTHAKH